MKKTLLGIAAALLFAATFATSSIAQTVVPPAAAYNMSFLEIMNTNAYTNYTGWTSTDGPTFFTNQLCLRGMTYSNLNVSAIPAGQFTDMTIQISGITSSNWSVGVISNCIFRFRRSIDGVLYPTQGEGAWVDYNVVAQCVSNTAAGLTFCTITNFPSTNYWRLWMVTNGAFDITNLSIKYYGRTPLTVTR